MKIIADCKPINISSGIQTIRNASRSLLLISIYLAGTAIGCVVYIQSDTVREFFNNAVLKSVYTDLSLTELICGSFTAALACCAVLFGAGLSLTGYPLSYALPFLFGAFSGLFFLGTVSIEMPLSVIKTLLMIPLFCVGACCTLSMSEYAADMTGMLTGKRSREADEWKKYTVRFLILTAATVLSAILQSFFILLFRHLN